MATQSPIYSYSGDEGQNGCDTLTKMEQIRVRCCVPALSCGAIHESKGFSDHHVGFCNIRDGLPEQTPKQDTVYTLTSLSKPFVTAAFGILEADGLISWTDAISTHLPEFCPEDDPDVANATFEEVFRHSAGIDNPVVLWLGPHGRTLITRDKFIELLNESPTRRYGRTLRNDWVYSNIAYGLVVLVIERISQTTFSNFVQERILDPLKMRNTVVTISQLEDQKDKDNLARTYAKMSDGSWKYLEHSWTDEKNGPVMGMLGMRSSVRDMLIFASALMDAYGSTASNESKDRMGAHEWSQVPFECLAEVDYNPLKNVESMLDGTYWAIPCDCNGAPGHTYYHQVPFVRANLPCNKFSWSSYNMTVANHHSASTRSNSAAGVYGSSLEKSKLSYHFNGTGVCGTTAFKLFPETRSAVVAFASGINVGDAAEFASLVATQDLFGLELEGDILSMVETEVECRSHDYDRVNKDVQDHKCELDANMDISEYAGEYSGSGIRIIIRPVEFENRLELLFNDDEDYVYALEPYGEDQFSYWPKSRDEWLAGGWLDWDHWEVGLIGFRRRENEKGKIAGATWVWENTGGPAFFKRTERHVAARQPMTEKASSVQNPRTCAMM